jgi:hypothetical protein
MDVKERQRSRRALRERAILGFALQQIISTLGAVSLGVAVTVIVALSTAISDKSASGSFIDHMVGQPVFMGVGQPYYPVLILAGLTLGLVSPRFFHAGGAPWVWVLPLTVLLWHVFTWRNHGYLPYWSDIWNNYFGSNCGSSECLYELFVTVPFYASAAYTAGWLAFSWVPAVGMPTSRTRER